MGGINEKIEGWFETCKILGMTGTQGVVIPRRNLDDLMLNDEVLEAVRAKRFHVYAIDRVEEGLEILTGVAAGSPMLRRIRRGHRVWPAAQTEPSAKNSRQKAKTMNKLWRRGKTDTVNDIFLALCYLGGTRPPPGANYCRYKTLLVELISMTRTKLYMLCKTARG